MDWNVEMGGNQQHQETTPPRLCAGGCGFFGTAEKQGLCSKCYKDRLKEAMGKTQAADELNLNEKEINSASDEKEINPSAKSKSRCSVCRKKLGLLWYVCRCGDGFCSSHRHPEAHACTFDFKQAGKISIHHQNPICKPDKMTRRI